MMVLPAAETARPGTSLYGATFFARRSASSRQSAEVAVPFVIDLVRPTSVADVGCGSGTWLEVFAAHGISDWFGYDGSWASSSLTIPMARFQAVDFSKPIAPARRFDLAVSLEVAEHLPPEAADTFVASLTSLAPVILFSAAIPGQGGTGHVNEQWPAYWASRFLQHGYLCYDVVRPALWNLPTVAPWYAQNTLLFVQRGTFGIESRLDLRCQTDTPTSLVHPGMHVIHAQNHRGELEACAPHNLPLSVLLKALPGALAKSVRHRLKGR